MAGPMEGIGVIELGVWVAGPAAGFGSSVCRAVGIGPHCAALSGGKTG